MFEEALNLEARESKGDFSYTPFKFINSQTSEGHVPLEHAVFVSCFDTLFTISGIPNDPSTAPRATCADTP